MRVYRFTDKQIYFQKYKYNFFILNFKERKDSDKQIFHDENETNDRLTLKGSMLFSGYWNFEIRKFI